MPYWYRVLLALALALLYLWADRRVARWYRRRLALVRIAEDCYGLRVRWLEPQTSIRKRCLFRVNRPAFAALGSRAALEDAVRESSWWVRHAEIPLRDEEPGVVVVRCNWVPWWARPRVLAAVDRARPAGVTVRVTFWW